MIKTKTTISLIILLVVSVLLVQVLFLPSAVYADSHEGNFSTEQIESSLKCIGFGEGLLPFHPVNCGLQLIALMGTGVLHLFAITLALTGLMFDGISHITLQGDAYNLDPIRLGWSISRDVANLFFIIILLVIAIATTLRNMTYGAKQLLVKLVLVALFINFSLLVTQVVIDFTNILALQFYNAIGTEASIVEVVTNEGITIKGVEGARDITGTFIQGLNPQNIFKGYNIGGAVGAFDVFVQIMIAVVMGSVLILAAAFVLGAAAFLYQQMIGRMHRFVRACSYKYM